MTTTLHHRSRLDPPPVPHGRVELLPPPEVVPSEGSGAVLMTALPMLGSVGSIVFVATSQPGVRGYVAAGLFLLASLGFVVVSVWRQRAQRQGKAGDQRREYMSYLGQVRRSARHAARQQRDALLWDHPEPAHLPALAEERSRVWERKPGDADFLHVRYGRAPQPLALTLVPPESAPLDRVDPVAASGLHRLLATHRIQPDLPASLHLSAFSHVQVVGDRSRARALARAIVCGAATFHAPTDLLVAVVASDENMRHWEWTKWLPHAGSPRERDGVGPVRLMGGSSDELVPLLPADMADRPRFSPSDTSVPALPHVLVVVDGGHVSPANGVLTEEGVSGVTVLDLPDHWGEHESESRLRLHVSPDGRRDGQGATRVELARQDPIDAAGDQADLETAEALARRLTPLYVAGGAERGTQRSSDLMDLLGLPHVAELDVSVGWRRRPPRDQLRVPIGLSNDGGVVHLDIKETAEQGMGPHGLVIGATGSGKSELLRTLVLAMALTHSPEDLNFVLIDFKGGATFAGMAEMPHVSALITNLAQEMSLVDRMYAALDGETRRRQSLLRPAPNRSFQNLKEYRKARALGEDLPGIPSLFIVIDEFSELLASRPEFADLFAQTGRLGRSLGMHLLFASQRLEESKLRGLESNLSYRVGLRTFSAAESRGVLGVPDAYELPAVPGLGILRPDPATFVRFTTSYVSGPPPRRATRAVGGHAPEREIVPFTVGPVARHLTAGPDLPDVVPAPSEPDSDTASRSTLDIAVARMRGHGPEAHRIWLPPLGTSPTLDALLPDLARQPDLGLASMAQRAKGPLTVPLGLVDKPTEQEQEPLEVSLAGAGGHVAVVGAPLAGKSTMLRTVVTSLALTHTPQEVHFYVLDFGGSFTALRGLPHLSGVAGRSEPEVVHRIVAELEGIIDAREAFFRRHGIDSMETYRARRQPNALDDGYGDVFLVVDGWTTLRTEFDTLESEVSDLAQRGLTFGLHLVTSTTRWADLRSQVRDLFGTRLELRLGDPLDSDIDRRLAVNVPDERPGRGLTESRHHFLGALPRIDGRTDGVSVADGLYSLVASVRDAWSGPAGPRLRLLPEKISLAEVRAAAFPVDAEGRRHRPVDPAARRVVLGLDERALAPVTLDVDAEPHLVVFGEGGSGKSTLLRTYVQEVMDSRTPEQAKFVVVDYRRALLGEVPDDYLVSYFTSAVQATPELDRLAAYLRTRLPGPDATAEQLRSRSWREGKAELFLVVDDYELVAGSSGSPLFPLVDLIPQAVDVGLHVVLARRSGGASRALYEPVVQSLRDLSAPGVMLPGSPEEGPLLGSVRPQPGAPGRARLVSRASGVEVMQVAFTDPQA